MFDVRPIQSQEIDQALTLVLTDRAGFGLNVEAGLKSFYDLARRENYDLNQQMVVLQNDQVVFACLFVTNPGRTAFVFSAPPDLSNSALLKHSLHALRKLNEWAFSLDCNLLEVLLDTDDTAREDFFRRGGYRKLTDLIYQSRSCLTDEPLPAPSSTIRWLVYDTDHHDLFKQVIQLSYRDSLDCPELENLRDMEDVIRSHQAAGRFDPRCWKVLLDREQPCGVLLLSPLRTSPVIELVYMGLIPSGRQAGRGKILLEEALRCAQSRKADHIMLAVDVRNTWALRLYRRFGFTDFLRRRVMYYSSRWCGEPRHAPDVLDTSAHPVNGP